MDELVEKLEERMSSSEMFAALFEPELSGKIRQLPGENYARTF
jgi:DNA processing protein